MNKKQKLYSWGILILTFVLSIVLIFFISKNKHSLKSFIHSPGIISPIISIMLYGLLSITPIPSDPLSVINGALFGPIMGSVISWMGNNVGALVEYFIAGNIGNVADFKKQKEKLPFGLGKFPADSVWFLIFGRFVPQFGGKLTSIIAGLYKVSLWRYIWTMTLANLPGSALLALGGHKILKLF